MEIIDNKALLLRTTNPAKYAVIPKHKVLGEDGDGVYQVLVFWGLDESRVLRNLGVKDVPSPITGRYNWPGRYKPMAHQIETAAFLTMHRRAFCFNDPGTGKTLAALWAADYLMRLGKVRRVLILAPLSILESAWMEDIGRSVIHRSAIVAHHSKSERRIEMIQQDYEIVIINYDGLQLIADEVKNDGRFDLVIVDECNSLKNPQTRRWKAVASVLTPKTFLWMMTGTPAAQSPVDAYGLAKLVNPDGVPKFQTAWRDKVMNKISMFKWAPKADAQDKVFSALQPAIRFSKHDCLDLPPVLTQAREVPMTPQQSKYYKQLKEQMLIKAAGETISAVNAGVLVSKLLQVACIAYNTPVLTSSGWVPIQKVRDTDLLWDGEEWVQHEGLVYKGEQHVLYCHGVLMTPEHKVLTTDGWKMAVEIVHGESSAGLDRASVRLPDGVASTRHHRWDQDAKSNLAVSVRMWERSDTREPVSSNTAPTDTASLRLSAPEQTARHVEDACVRQLVQHDKSLRERCRQRLEKLRSAWNYSLQALAQVRELLAGHGPYVPARAHAGAQEQRQGLQPEELRVGHHEAARQQPTHEPFFGHTEGAHDAIAGGGAVRAASSHLDAASEQGLVDGGSVNAFTEQGVSAGTRQMVFDIANCGFRSRFVVKGSDGEALIVHNCGAAFTDEKEVVEFDCTPRMSALEEVLEETQRKVIIFALFRNSITTITNHLTKKGITNAVIHGDIPMTKRGPIIKDFQTTQNIRVLVMQPQATAHGITLTAADTVVFYGPLMSVEQYQQCIARADRKGQDAEKVTVIHIQSSPIEKKLFKAMESKVSDHALLVGMFDSEVRER